MNGEGLPPADAPVVLEETPAEAQRRHQRVTARRHNTQILCHRGAVEFAPENTLEAFRAAFELGADGNELDIRATADGVLVCFHDDMLDRLLEAYGDVGDYRWEELRRFRFRDPGPFGEPCRIPTLLEAFDLHRRHAGLMHLDLKRPDLDETVADLLDRMDLWGHVAYCNPEHADALLGDPRLHRCRYKADGLYLDGSEVFPDAIAAALARPGDGVIVDDPRGVAAALGRPSVPLSRAPVAPRPPAARPVAPAPEETGLIAILCDAADAGAVAETTEAKRASGRRIRARAHAAEQLLLCKEVSPEACAALEERVRHRSLHPDWREHGLDGAMALRALILLQAPNAVETARFVLWRDDSALEAVSDPRWKHPRSWADFRAKAAVFPALERCPGAAVERLCRDYLALSDEAAWQLGPTQFEPAAKALLAVSPTTRTALELMGHRRQDVRARAILSCLACGREAWSRAALEYGASHALAYLRRD